MKLRILYLKTLKNNQQTDFQIRVNSINPTIVLTVLGRRGWSDPVKKGKALDRIPIGRLAGKLYNTCALTGVNKS